MPIPTFVSAGVGNGALGDLTCVAPAGSVADDIWLYHVESSGESAVVPSGPAGWTLIDSIANDIAGSGWDTRCTLYWIRYNGTTPDLVFPDTGDHTLGFISAYRGCITTENPINVSQTSSDDLGDKAVSATGVTTDTDDCLIVATSAAGDNITLSGWTNSNLASPAITESQQHNTASGTDGAIASAYGGLAATGVSGTTTLTSSANEREANIVIALTPAPSGPGSETGTIDVTFGDFTSTASGKLTFNGSLSETLDNFTLAAEGTTSVPIDGTIAVTLDNFTSDISAIKSVSGSIAETLDDFTVAASGGSVSSGSLAETLDNIVSIASGSISVDGNSSYTIESFVSTISGDISVSGTISETLENVGITASGTVGSGETGEINYTIENITSGISAVASVSGNINSSFGTFTSTITGGLSVDGTTNTTVGDFTLAASGTAGNLGTINVTLGAFISSVSGGVSVSGDILKTFNAFTLVADGTIVSDISGTINETISDFSLVAEGTVPVVGDRVGNTYNVVINDQYLFTVIDDRQKEIIV